MALHLASDILEDHFGGAVERVGTVLLRRGALSVQEIMRFTTEQTDRMSQEPLRFQHVRNALLTLVQHGLVTVKPHPQAANSGDDLRKMMQVYSMDVEDVIIRLRFPKFVEYCFVSYGDIAAELLMTTLKFGGVTAEFAVAETKRAITNVSNDEVHQDFWKLVDKRLICPAEPCTGARGLALACGSASPAPPIAACAASSSSSVAAASPPPLMDRDSNGSRLGNGAKRKRSPLNDDDESEEGQASTQVVAMSTPLQDGVQEAQDQVVKPFGAPQQAELAPVFRFNRPVLDLCVRKNMICRLVEERVNSHAAQVVATLLTGVQPRHGGGRGVDVAFMKFQQINGLMNELGFHQAGRDPERQKDKLFKVLDLLAAHKDGLVKRRSLQSSAPPISDGGGSRPLRRGAAAPTSALQQPQGELVSEWCLDWQRARKLLVDAATSQLIRDQFGIAGLRMFNLLSEANPPQRLEEWQIFSICMVPPAEGREALNEMVRRAIVNWQEVPRNSSLPLVASYWLYYVDHRRLESALVWNVLQAILNLRVRFRQEMANGAALESRAGSLTKREKHMLRAGRRVEDILERSYLVLDAGLLVFKEF